MACMYADRELEIKSRENPIGHEGEITVVAGYTMLVQVDQLGGATFLCTQKTGFLYARIN